MPDDDRFIGHPDYDPNPGLGKSRWRSVDAQLLAYRHRAEQAEAQVRILNAALHSVSVMGRTSRFVAGDPLSILAERALEEANP